MSHPSVSCFFWNSEVNQTTLQVITPLQSECRSLLSRKAAALENANNPSGQRHPEEHPYVNYLLYMVYIPINVNVYDKTRTNKRKPRLQLPRKQQNELQSHQHLQHQMQKPISSLMWTPFLLRIQQKDSTQLQNVWPLEGISRQGALPRKMGMMKRLAKKRWSFLYISTCAKITQACFESWRPILMEHPDIQIWTWVVTAGSQKVRSSKASKIHRAIIRKLWARGHETCHCAHAHVTFQMHGVALKKCGARAQL